MRALFILILLLAILIRTVGAVQAGVLGWTWLTLMTPQMLAWGFGMDWPLNLVLAVVTFIAWFLSREPKRLPINAVMVLWLAFMAYVTFTTFFALVPELAWARWNLAIKVMILGLMVASVMTTQVRIHALVWIIVLSLGYFGVKGGIFTIITAGQFQVLPTVYSLGDNNNLALALCMILPLMNYLRMQSANRIVRIGMVTGMSLVALGILGTYSRGGLIGLAIMAAYLWLHSNNKVVVALLALSVAIPAYNFMPAKWIERMATIQTADLDVSFQERLEAWRTGFNLAKARPFTGGGFNATESPVVFKNFVGNPSYDGGGRAAHSIYFEVLGDHGFVGLALYVALLVLTWHYAGATRRKARLDPKLGWIADLASMIQVSLASFIVAGAALSMAYYDMFYLLLGMAIVLRKMVVEPRATIQATAPLAMANSATAFN